MKTLTLVTILFFSMNSFADFATCVAKKSDALIKQGITITSEMDENIRINCALEEMTSTCANRERHKLEDNNPGIVISAMHEAEIQKVCHKEVVDLTFSQLIGLCESDPVSYGGPNADCGKVVTDALK